MRVVEPKELQKRSEQRHKQKRRSKHGVLIVVLVFVGLLGYGGWLIFKSMVRIEEPSAQIVGSQSSSNEPLPTINESEKTTLRTFKPDEFKNLYRSVNYPNVTFIKEPPAITGNAKADAIIRNLAEDRGFILTSTPVSPISKTGEPLLKDTDDDLLQPYALKAWQELEKEAQKDNMPLQLISAYRSLARQRDLFMERLLGTGVTVEQIAQGLGREQIQEVLFLAAIPGYSRHHTGYTIDLHCDDGLGAFEGSSCDKWLTADNYKKAKQHGWIPSYPPGAKEQGPEPEAWEYVWVGTDHLYE